MIAFFIRSLFKDSAIKHQQPELSDWKSFAERHATAFEKIVVTGMSMTPNMPAQEKTDRLNYMYENIALIRGKETQLKAAEKILIATTFLDKDTDSSLNHALFYIAEACQIIVSGLPQVFASDPALARSSAKTALETLCPVTGLDKQNPETGDLTQVIRKRLEEFTEEYLTQSPSPASETIKPFIPT